MYVNDYNGNVIMQHNTMETGGSLMPMGLTQVYNSNDKDTDIGYGYGVRLNYHQTIRKITIAGTEYYKHTDGDGTVHYFVYDSTKEMERGNRPRSGTDTGKPEIPILPM